MSERLGMIKTGQRIGFNPETIDEALNFVERYRLDFMGKNPKVAMAVSYRIAGLMCKDSHTWYQILNEMDVQPPNTWKTYRGLLNSRSEKLKEIGVTKEQLEYKVRRVSRKNGDSSRKEEEEISKIFRDIFY